MLRVLLAGLFVFAGLLASVAVVASLEPRGWLGTLAIVASMFLLLAAALWLFNPRGTVVLPGTSLERRIEELAALGLLAERSFRATRAFGVDEFEDEGLHYYLELADGAGVLFLSGQYLYDFEPIDDDPDVAQARRFPCTEFTVRRHAQEHYVVDVLCGGEVLEPEVIAPPFSVASMQRDDAPGDGDVIRDRSYEELKAGRLAEPPPRGWRR